MTAEQFIMENTDIMTMAGNKQKVAKAMIAFAQMHVKKALEAQGKLAKRCIVNKVPVPSLEFLAMAYPLTNIK